MKDEPAVPIIIGHAGLVGRQQIVRVPDVEPDEDGNLTLNAGAMPGNCRRVLSSPLPVHRGGGCDSGCQGFQRDGCCLLDVVRAAEAAGIKDWRFQIDPVDGFWEYAGTPIPGFDGAPRTEGDWLEKGWERERRVAAPPSFVCPFCDAHVTQDPLNFHYWCPSCGRNAKEE